MSTVKCFVLIVFSFWVISCNFSNKNQDQKQENKLIFDDSNFELQDLSVDGNTFTVRAYENIVYVQNPVDTTYQVMNIYIPTEYFEGKSKKSYTAETAPIFFPNQVGGYMPGKPGTAIQTNERRPKTIAVALSKGFVVASPGARGRTLQNEDGLYTGKAPAAIVDLKAAVRYLKYNDKNMPGDANKIISNGTSAGGALSALLGASGNSKEYEPYLNAIGAAKTTDNIYAVSAYCPITNLDNADIAYEWQFNGINIYQSRRDTGRLTQEEIEVSNQLCKFFPEYVNSLQLKSKDGELLQLDSQGNGNFKDLIKSYVIASANTALKAGKDLSVHNWISVNNDTVTDIDFKSYINYLCRMKTPPAFDALDLSTPENSLFGNSTTDKQHFTKYSLENSHVESSAANEAIVRLMNPMYFIGQKDVDISNNWRIRHGTKDSDTSLAISVLLATLLQNNGYNVNYAMPWDVPHSGDYDLDELFFWINDICKK